MFSILRTVKIFTDNGKTLHSMWRYENPGRSTAFVEACKMRELELCGWRIGESVAECESIRSNDDMLDIAEFILANFRGMFPKETFSVVKVVVTDEYIRLTKRGKLDHKSLFQDSISIDNRGRIQPRERWTEATMTRELV